MVKITLLAEHPEWVPVVGRWHWDEWGHHDPEGSLEKWTAGIGRRANRDRIPMAFIATVNGEPVGSSVLVAHDMSIRMDLTPWLAGVFVLPDHRGRGVGAELVRAAESAAEALGAERLYLYTRSAEGLYAKLGWEAIERCDYEGRAVVIMGKTL